MDELIDAIRSATAADATTDARAAGATACRTLLIALEAQEGHPLAAPVAIPQPQEVAALVAGLKGVPVDQLLDLAIAKLRALVPPDQAPRVASLAIPLVPMPRRP
jgi:hypothetical protein